MDELCDIHLGARIVRLHRWETIFETRDGSVALRAQLVAVRGNEEYVDLSREGLLRFLRDLAEKGVNVDEEYDGVVWMFLPQP